MPVILRPEDYSLWLNHSMHDPEQLRGMFEPIPSEILDAYKVPDLVNNVRYDGVGCIARILLARIETPPFPVMWWRFN